MTVGQFRASGDEGHVQPVRAKLHHRIAGRAFGDLELDAGIGLAIFRDQFSEEAAGIRAWMPMRSRPHSPDAVMPTVFTA